MIIFFKVQNLKPYLRLRTFNWGLANARYALYNLHVTLLISVARITVSEKKIFGHHVIVHVQCGAGL